MTDSLSFNPRSTALLLMDFQGFVLHNFLTAPTANQVVSRAAALLEASRAAEMLTIHMTVGFRENYPEISARNKLFSKLKESGLVSPGNAGVKIHPNLTPKASEPVVVKHRIGAFTNTDLQQILCAQRIDTLLLAGVTTAGVVLSTVRQAFDLDYELIVASDACADPDADLHARLMEKVVNQHATVAPVAEIQGVLPRARGHNIV
ncbi:cysteine hydrolase [Ensifer sp. NBAIM29]|nr:cysteine hydrolase [Ensifer sp. NBAIM29]